MPEVKEEKVPIIFIELCDKQDSGFVKDGTERTPFEERLNSPSVSWIPTQGKRLVKVDENGKPLKTPYTENIRYIRHESEISVRRQRELGIEPTNGGKADKIVIEKGYMSLAREGVDIGLFDYLSQAFYNESNPDRSARATAIYKIVEVDEQAEAFNENEIISADAVAYVGKLRIKVADGKYKYNQEKIDGLCSLFTIFAESNAAKLQAILWNAKSDPKSFMELVSKWENTTESEITQALSLNVIRFEENMAVYVGKDKVIYSLGTEKMNHKQKISKLGDWLRTADGHEAYMELKAELEAAQEKSLK